MKRAQLLLEVIYEWRVNGEAVDVEERRLMYTERETEHELRFACWPRPVSDPGHSNGRCNLELSMALILYDPEIDLSMPFNQSMATAAACICACILG
jgi:hypothetical protein